MDANRAALGQYDLTVIFLTLRSDPFAEGRGQRQGLYGILTCSNNR